MKEFQQADCRISIYYYARTYFLIAIAIFISLKIRSPLLYAVAVLFIAARQHTLYLLNHDAGHGTLFESEALNKWVATLFSVCPFFHHMNLFSFSQWRKAHRMHHDFLFTENDPTWLDRERRGETRSPLSPGQLLKNCAKSVYETFRCTLIGKQYLYADAADPSCKRKIFHMNLLLRQSEDKELEQERRVKILFFLCAFSAIFYFGVWKEFLLYWIVPLFVALPPILYLRDSIEHNWSADPARREENTNTIIPRLWEKIFIIDTTLTLHWEHHLNPRVPFYRLRAFSGWLRTDPAALSRFQPQPRVSQGIFLRR